MEIHVYRNQSDPRRISKTLTNESVLEGTFRNESSIFNPIIRTEWEQTASKINYLYIPAYDRYYYITEIIRIRDRIIEIHGRCDVLMSFKDEIIGVPEDDNKNGLNVILKKNANRWNLYIDDGSLKVQNNPKVFTKNFPYGFQNQEFVLAVAGS